jgi:GcrA cell cycle regulator
MQSTDWPPQHSEALREHMAKGMSYSAIADAINAKFRTSYSRNATVGRARRMGLAGPGQFEDLGKPLPTAEAPRLRAINPRMRERHVFEFWRLPPVFEATEFQLRTADVVPRHLSLIDLEHGDCRYPYGGGTEGEAITFCGHRQRPGSSYCAAHFDLSVGPGTASERSAHRDLLKAVEAERNADQTDLRTSSIQGAIQHAARQTQEAV